MTDIYVKSIEDTLGIKHVKKISPAAVHIKEVNHIDPISVESLNVSQVKNIEPISINEFNVTNLPMLNMSLRQLPAVDMNIRKLPPISVGTHQEFHVPSNYTLRARFLGVELFRLNLDGRTMLVPKERARREQARNANRSFPETAVAGNPAIPSIHIKKDTVTVYSAPCCHSQHHHSGHADTNECTEGNAASPAKQAAEGHGSLSVGLPNMRIDMREKTADLGQYHSSINSGD